MRRSRICRHLWTSSRVSWARPRRGLQPSGGDQSSSRCAPAGGGRGRGDDARRVPVDLQLIIGGMLLGTFLGIVAGRWCAAYPRTGITRALRVAIAVLLSCPPYFLALLVLLWFSWNSGEYRLPFVRPGRLPAVRRGPAGVHEGDVGPVGVLRAAARRARRPDRGGEHQRGARRGLRPHRPRQGPPRAAGAEPPRAAGRHAADRRDDRRERLDDADRGRGDRVRLRDPRDVPDDPRCDLRSGRPRAGGAGPRRRDPRGGRPLPGRRPPGPDRIQGSEPQPPGDFGASAPRRATGLARGVNRPEARGGSRR